MIPWTIQSVEFSRPEYWSEWLFPSPEDLPNPGNRTQVSRTPGRFFTSLDTREAQEYWSGYLFLLQWIFPTQESNSGLPHCRRILYELRYQGSLILIYVGYEQHSSYHPLFLNSANIVNVALISSNPDPYESSPHNTLIWAGLEQYLIQYCHGKR